MENDFPDEIKQAINLINNFFGGSEHKKVKKYPEIPEGYVQVVQFANQSGIASEHFFRTLIKKHNIPTVNRGDHCFFDPNEIIKTLVSHKDKYTTAFNRMKWISQLSESDLYRIQSMIENHFIKI